MARLRVSLVVFLMLLMVSCLPDSTSVDKPGDTGSDSGLAPQPSPSPTLLNSGTPQLVILSPLQIDSANGRLYAVAQVNGELKIAVLSANDGSLLAAWDNPGQLALDAERERLVVDRGAQGVALVDTATGETQATVHLPPQDGPPAPQVNAASGLVYAFRNSTIYVIDPAIRDVIRSTTLEITRTVCDNPSGDAPIYQTAYEPAAGRLYLSFITQTCLPWSTITLIAYDTTTGAEIGRTEADINTQFIPVNESLYGSSVNRLGPTLYWAWDGLARWHESGGDFQGQPAGMAVDTERDLIYEAIGEMIRIIDPKERELTGQQPLPLLAGSQLSGHDSGSDNLYFTTLSGRLYTWPATNLFDEVSTPESAPSPLPPVPVRAMALAPGWSTNRTMAAILDDPGCNGSGQLFIMINPSTGWVPSATGPEGSCPQVTAMAFSPAYTRDTLLFAATSQPPTILRSLDTGRSWTAAETPFPEGTHIIQLLPSTTYAADQTIFALTAAGLAYRSRDGGQNWQLLDQRLDHLALSGGAGPAIDLFGVFRERVLRSSDGGQRWQDVGPTPGSEPLALFAVAPSAGEYPILFGFSTGGRFTRSLDGGVTWNPIMETSAGPVQLAIAGDLPEDQRAIFLLHDNSIIASYDGMASIWASAPAEQASRFQPTAIAISPEFGASPYLLAGTADGQIVRVRADAQP